MDPQIVFKIDIFEIITQADNELNIQMACFIFQKIHQTTSPNINALMQNPYFYIHRK